jgi:hypothetical protein
MLRAVWWRNWVASSWCNRADTCEQIRGHILVPAGGPTDTWGKKGTPRQTPFRVHWQPHGTARGTKGHHLRVRSCPNSVWAASSTAAARVQSGTSVYSVVREGGGAEHSTESRSNVDRSGSAVLPECEIVFPAKFQTCNGGDMVCVRGSLEARLAAKREGASRRGRIWNRGQPLCFSIA